MRDESDLAEFWWMRQGQRVPRRDTAEWKAMFEAWRAFAVTRGD